MKKTFLSLLLVMSMLFSLGLGAYAAGEAGGTVLFDGEKLISSYTKFEDIAGSLEPGDDGTIVIKLTNGFKESADWWLKNEILKNFLASEAGGAYTYKLTFLAPGGSEKTIYDSDRIGGETGGGLKEVNSSLKDYVYLGEIGPGKTGELKLYFKLDGETKGNAYKNSFAQLKLNFAVELTSSKVVKTGDDTNTMPYLTASAISGGVLLVLAFVSLGNNRKKQRGEAA